MAARTAASGAMLDDAVEGSFAQAHLRRGVPARRARGVVQPENFIPLLEETGLITEIGSWVLREACAQGAIWRAAGSCIDIAVNVSARQLDSDDLVSEVRKALDESGLDPRALTIEITETTLMRDAEQTVRRLTAIKALGVRIAIDDSAPATRR